MSKLVIVESPAKAHTIQKYLGPDYEVMASMGHVRDLPASRMSVDVKNDFAPNYENIKGKGELIKKLRAEAKKSDYVYLATDPDREGEAISWHLAQLLKLDETEPNRVTFNEITKSGVTQGMEHPRQLDMDLAHALAHYLHLDQVTLILCGGQDQIAAQREQWNDGSNTLCIRPGVVIAYDRNYITNEILESYGITVLKIPSGELSRGRGGPRCMSMPLIRDVKF